MNDDLDPLENADLVLQLEEEWLTEQARLASLRLMKALRLAKTIDDLEALLRGEPVPIANLDPEWCRRYGIA